MQLEHLTDREDKAFVAHIGDLLKQAEKRNVSRFTGFLDLRQLTLARQLVSNAASGGVCFYGGYADAQRVMMGVFASYEEPPFEPLFPIAPLTVNWRRQDEIGHRDLLGSFMGLGIKRETVGDILIEPGLAVCFLTNTGRDTVMRELQKVGRCGVKLQEGAPEQLPQAQRFLDMVCVVSSLRLDCVVAALTGLSREKTAALIRGQAVRVNGGLSLETSRLLDGGEILSLRGHGKFVFVQPVKSTKKGRLQILCKKYI